MGGLTTTTTVAPRRAFWTVYVAAFVALTLFYGAPFLAGGASLSQAARNALAALLPNALLGVIAVRLPRRLPWHRGNPLRFVTAHGAVLLALALLATGGWMALGALDSWIAGTGFAVRANRAIILFQTLVSGLVQLALVGVGHAWHGAERFARAESLRARAELALLRSQLNPHFVLNTLHALMGLVRREPAEAEAALERLGELLRFGLHVHHANVDQVAFREEWAFVKSYLELEKLRFGERLSLTMRAGDDVMDVPIPPFALQPLVENAIVHAIGPRREGGRLDVQAHRREGRLRVEVQDDGPGTSEAAVLESPRLGLRLLRERLAALYTGEARLAFEPVAQGGTRVVLDLPDDGRREAA
jgi:two-component system, LytTR family, sensor kinase